LRIDADRGFVADTDRIGLLPERDNPQSVVRQRAAQRHRFARVGVMSADHNVLIGR
jgi:hypothetical protein